VKVVKPGSGPVLVAGIGNVFFRDDGFGVAVVELLRNENDLPGNVVVRDIGIRGLHLAYDLVTGWDLLIVVDAIATATAAGTLHLIEPSGDLDLPGRAHDAHGMDLRSILQTTRALEARLPAVLVVGCEVTDVSEGMGLTPEVARAVPRAARMVRSAVRGERCHTAADTRMGSAKEA
jgi:hydrogenase maturation protease